MPKRSTKSSTVNPNARATKNYSIVEDLAQSPCAMSALEALQSCPAQRSALLIVIGAVDPKNSHVITFHMSSVKRRLPHHMAFHIKSTYQKMNIFRAIVDERVTACIMSMSFWKSIGSLEVVPSTTLLTAFDGHSHRSHGILTSFPVCVGGKVVNVKAEIVDANLDYNILWGQNWVYAMDVIISSSFHILCFPHEGRIVTIDQMAYSPNDPNAYFTSTIPLVMNTKQLAQNLGVGIYSSLMGIFYLPPTAHINDISSSRITPHKGSFRTHYFFYPWSLPPLQPH